MEHLRKLFEELGFANVSTFIASGNVIFDAGAAAADGAELEQRIEARLRQALGYEVATFVRTPSEVAAAVEFRPFAAEETAGAAGHTVHVAFLRQPLGEEVGRKLLALRTAVDEFQVHGREFYWLCRVRISDSLVRAHVLAKTLATPTTMRNTTMLRKLVAAYPPDG